MTSDPTDVLNYWAACGTQLWNGLSPSKKDKMANGTPRRLCLTHCPFNGAYFCVGMGRIISGRLGRTESYYVELLALGSYPISTPNINTVFDDVISLRGSCRNNALPRSPWEKLQLAACEKPFLTKGRNNLLLCHAIHIVFGEGQRGEPGENNANRLLFQKLYIYIVKRL